MPITSKQIKYVVLTIGVVGCLIVAAILFSILYESRKDISHQEPYVSFLNQPQKLTVASTILWNKTNLRFSNYSLVLNENSNFNTKAVKSVKQY